MKGSPSPIPSENTCEEERFGAPLPVGSILDSLEDGVIILNRSGAILRVNPSFCRFFPCGAVGRNAADVVDVPAFTETLEAFLRDLPSEAKVSPTLRITLKDDLVFSVRITPFKQHVSQFSSASVPAAVAIFHNISDLVRLSRRRKEFMGEIAHELRTPLTTIIGFAETILDLPPHHTEDRQKFTGIILRSARRMAMLVGDMLHLSKLETGTIPLDLSCVRATFLLEDALDACAPRFEARKLKASVHVDRSINIMADEHLVTQVFRNLLENASRYAPEGSTITVTGERSPFEPVAVFTVSDEGPGVPEKDVERIFERFYRVEKERVPPSSTGLGLAICKHIVERHGGVIRAEKGPGGLFLFTIPLAQ